jgi:hypothetical protein
MKKAQIRMTETIAVLFVFFIIVVFGLIFYSQIQRSSFEKQKIAAAQEMSVSVSLRALFLPELRCSKGENIQVRDCIDLFKLESAGDVMDVQKDYYFHMFNFAKISVQEIYPGNQNWVLYENVKEGATTTIRTPVPVSLFEPVQRNFRFGVLTIETYS